MRRILVFISLLTFAGCQPSESVPLPTEPDASTVPIDLGIQDVLVVPDVAIRDAAPVPMDAGIPDYVVDVPLATPPTEFEYALVGGGDESWFVWWRGGRLFARKFTVRIAPAESNSLGPIEPERVSIEAGEVVSFGYAPPFQGRLDGARAPNAANGHPGWFVVPGVDGELAAYDIAQPDASPAPLGVTASFALGSMSAGAESEDVVTIVGNRDGQAVYQLLRGQAGLQLVDNDVGYPVPTALTTSGNRWIYGFDDGTCALLLNNSDGPSDALGSWMCGVGPGTKIIGRGALGEASPGVYAVGQTADALVAWDIRPGSVAYPGPIALPTSPDEPAPREDAGVDDAGVDDAGVIDADLDDSGPPDAESSDAAQAADMGQPLEEESPVGVQEILQTDRPVRWLNRLPDGQAALAEGTVILMNRWSIRTISSGDSDPLAAILGTGDVPFVIVWDPETGHPTATRASTNESMPPPEYREEACPGRLPEVCDNADLDCDGYPKAELCCQANLGFDSPILPSREQLVGDFFIKTSDTGTLGVLRYADRVELRNFVESSEDTTGYGCWSHTTALTHVANQATTLVMAGAVQATPDGASTCPEGVQSVSPAVPMAEAQGDAGITDMGASDATPSDAGVDAAPLADAAVEPEPSTDRNVLMWRTSLGNLSYTDAPCETVRHLDLYRSVGGYHVLVFCDDARYDYTLAGDEISASTRTPYAFGSARWIGPPVKRMRDGESDTYVLAASSETSELHLIHIGYRRILPNGDEHVVSVTETEPSDQNTAVPMDLRDLPFRPSVDGTTHPARIRDQRWVEVFMPGIGWRRGVSHQWPMRAYFSAHDDFAITVAEEQNPSADGFDPINQNILGFVHDLRVAGKHWGRKFPLKRQNIDSALRAVNYSGVAIPDFGLAEGERTIWLATGGTSSNLRLEGQMMICRGQEE